MSMMERSSFVLSRTFESILIFPVTMMRDLGTIDGVRTRFRATFERFGKKSGYKVPWVLTILLIDVKRVDDEKIMTDHAWMTAGKQFKSLDLHSGDIIDFDARVGMYQKGYSEDDEENPFRYDYRLERPTKMEKVGKSDGDFTTEERLSQEIREKVESDEFGISPVKIIPPFSIPDENIARMNVTPPPVPKPVTSIQQKSLLDFIRLARENPPL